jgi:hypothetical protein
MAAIQSEIEHGRRRALERIGELVAEEARSEFGTYQPAVADLPAWAPLADDTLNDWQGHPGKITLGYASEGTDNPLLREGDQRDSISHTVESDREVVIGSPDIRMVYSELGTESEPPRSTLARAAIKSTPEALRIAAEEALGGLVGGRPRLT